MKLFSLIYQGDIHPATDQKIIPAESYSKLLEAEEIISAAREDAARLAEETREKCEAIKEEAYKKGFEEGLQKLNETIIELDREQKKMRHDLHRLVLPVALTAAKKLVGKQLELFPDTIVDIVLQAIAPATQCQSIVIYVSKEDQEALEAARPKIAEILPQVKTIAIQAKPDLQAGSCIIQTEKGMINATIENQWNALERAFMKFSSPTQSED